MSVDKAEGSSGSSDRPDRPSMQQEWHPDHNMPAPEHDGVTPNSMPDFSGKITGQNAPENNWKDQRSTDNKYRNARDIGDAGSWRDPVSPYAMDYNKKKK